MKKAVKKAKITASFDTGKRAVIFRPSQPIVNTLIREGEVILGAAVIIGGLAARAKDPISRRNVLRCGVGATLAAVVLGDCGSTSNDNNSNGSCPSGSYARTGPNGETQCINSGKPAPTPTPWPYHPFP